MSEKGDAALNREAGEVRAVTGEPPSAADALEAAAAKLDALVASCRRSDNGKTWIGSSEHSKWVAYLTAADIVRKSARPLASGVTGEPTPEPTCACQCHTGIPRCDIAECGLYPAGRAVAGGEPDMARVIFPATPGEATVAMDADSPRWNAPVAGGEPSDLVRRADLFLLEASRLNLEGHESFYLAGRALRECLTNLAAEASGGSRGAATTPPSGPDFSCYDPIDNPRGHVWGVNDYCMRCLAAKYSHQPPHPGMRVSDYDRGFAAGAARVVEAVEALHRGDWSKPDPTCVTCGPGGWYVPWPCPTVRAARGAV